MSKFYSIWLEPTGELDSWLHDEMEKLFPQYDSPLFRPHITLLGDIAGTDEADVIRRADNLAKSLQPLDVEFDHVAAGKLFYQNVYILCKKTEGMAAAGKATRTAFDMDPESTFMPHLSLIYGNLAQEKRKALATELQQRYFESDPQSKERRTLKNGFTAERITLMQTTPNETDTWSLIKAYTLQKTA